MVMIFSKLLHNLYITVKRERDLSDMQVGFFHHFKSKLKAQNKAFLIPWTMMKLSSILLLIWCKQVIYFCLLFGEKRNLKLKPAGQKLVTC